MRRWTERSGLGDVAIPEAALLLLREAPPARAGPIDERHRDAVQAVALGVLGVGVRSSSASL